MKTILVIDDEPMIRSLVQLSLENRDWHVAMAADAGSALAEIERRKPDLILLDLGLPGTSGEDLARRLRTDESTAAIPIVFLTGLRPTDAANADAVIQKPFTPDLLRAYASNWL